MKKVLVTGADGFIGSHLTELLVDEGYQVKALSQYNSFNYWGWLEDAQCLKDIEVLTGDVRDPHYCRHITKDVDLVFHLAALIAIPYSYVAPDSYVDANIKGTLNICQAALDNGVERVIHTSTSEVYGTAQYVPIDEAHPLQPQSPYSASKIAADAMAMSYYNAFGLPLTVARPFNTYGPRQSARAVIPTIIAQIASGKKQIQLGDVSPTRDFNYVEDTCRGFLALARCEQAIGRTVNIASNYEISVGDTLEIIRELMRSDVEFVTDSQRLRPGKSEVFRLWGDNRLIRELAGFEPRYDIRAGLQKTIDWFVQPANLAKYKADIYNV
ncbi:NAD-dependent 4,6-dehydratase LegB [Alkalilimnicola sp. S0819]|uniref:NAD-dependent 4,6-dehydratase LegB n=1 Tax=Alkalilimnicola sp. S0819 TaxID=2613922 RepID=UPI0012617125|nr:NAD-dependent 4,6-dehydratase LegB [Alkalilimnicola sp. S0819]KAB7628231.1 SDR family NAD(P)-dependent oxidoreductase [Alkalilimnicola sp. S0819]MPQ15122.1 SDR family NAD(P)-dependent oxidoreductase [Alkalilimnicola sp. S0819]